MTDSPGKIEHDQDLLEADLGAYERDTIQVARQDPATFGEYVFGWKAQPLHDEWQDLCNEYRRLVIFAPVEHGKSMQISVCRLSWEIGKNTNIRAALVSNTAGQAHKFLGVIRQTIGYNARYQAVFPHVRPERRRGRVMGWQDSHIVVERKDLSNKDYTVEAVGVNGNIMGARLDLAILDDILDFENTLTRGQRKRVIEYVKNTVISRLTALARLWMIGNAWHAEDAMHWAAANTNYHVERYDADDDLWPDLEIMPSGEVCGWPEWRRKERLAEVSSIEYARSMKNIPDKERGSDDFSRAAIETCVELAEAEGRHFVSRYDDNELQVYVGVDLAVKKKRGAHETVFFIGGVDPHGTKVVLNIIAGRMGLVDIIKNFCQIQDRFKPVLFEVENNSAQDYLLQFLRGADEIFRAIIKNTPSEGSMALDEIKRFAKAIRLHPFTTGKNKADPTLGVRAMSVDFENRMWRIPRNHQSAEWIDDMLRFDPVEHTGDRLMASWFFTSACGKRTRGGLKATSLGK